MQKTITGKMKGATMVLMIGLVSMLPACTTQTAVKDTGAAEVDTVKRVVWHVDYKDPMRLGRMLTSVNNMVITYDSELADYDIRIVFLGAGIRFITSDPLKKTPFAEDKMMRKERKVLTERLLSAMSQGIKLEVCKVTTDALGVDDATILKGATLVPSGVVRIVELQSKGYGYLKAD